MPESAQQPTAPVAAIDQTDRAEGTHMLQTDARSDAEHRTNAEESLIAWRDVSNAVPDDPVRLYLREISQMPLLTAEQEVKLAQQIAVGALARQRLDQELYGSS
jgi:DNA-directed RNA polymerase sigma subunit (sigma70/sigma32)